MKHIKTLKKNNNCFVEGTRVYTNEGYKAIETLQPGDIVLTHKNRFRKITKVEIIMNQIIWKVTTIEDKTLETTNEHLLLASQIEEIHYTSPTFKKVKKLNYNDFLVGPLNKLGDENNNYTRTKITSIVNTHTFDVVYKIEVEDDHSYMVERYFVHD